MAIAEQHAATDSLTGLPNKRTAEVTVKRLVAKSLQSGSPLTALMCDLDHFKTINDRFGHASGDDVLAAAGAVIGDSLRVGDFAARYGGEEFLILLPAADVDTGSRIAERIRAGVAALRIPSVDQRITISLGLAVAPDHAVDAHTLTRAADRALYAAKSAGRNRVEVSTTRGDPPGPDVEPRHDGEVPVDPPPPGNDLCQPSESDGSAAPVPLAVSAQNRPPLDR